jgi:dTDP-4-dehydrorhamnose 3,5-epimerase
VLSDSADVVYKVTDYYTPASERSIRWDDPALGIVWPETGVAPTVSAKDQAGAPVGDVIDEIGAALAVHAGPR